MSTLLPGRPPQVHPPVRVPGDRRAWLRHARRSLRQAVGARRRLVTAALVAAGVAAALQALAPPPPPTEPVLVAAADLPAGLALTDADVKVAHWPAELVPPGGMPSLEEVVGAVLATPLRAGEAVSGTRLLGAGLLVGQPPGTGSMAVRLAEPVSGLVRAGDRVDLLAGPDPDAALSPGAWAAAGRAVVAASDVLVLAVGGAGSGPTTDNGPDLLGGPAPAADESGGTLVVALTQAGAMRLQALGAGRSLAVMVRPSS